MSADARVVGVVRETWPGETRVALSPEVAGKLIKAGMAVLAEPGAGVAAAFPDADYAEAGVEFAERSSVLSQAQVLLTVRPLAVEEVSRLKPGAVVAGALDPARNAALLEALAAKGASAYALELLPRTTRAQSMDVLSSQANLAGYRAVLEAAAAYGRTLPMMTTAAGTITPAKVFVMGAGVAGLQAIAPLDAWGRWSPPPTCVPPPRNRCRAWAQNSWRWRTRSSRPPNPPAATPRR